MVCSLQRFLLAVCLLVVAAGCSSHPVAAPSATGTAAPLRVTSTLDGLSSLPLRIHWVAMTNVPASDVSEVDFLIDGVLAWKDFVSRTYGDDGNWLVTSFLTPGEHTFTVKVFTLGGQSATDAAHASVSTPAPVPITNLVGTWSRTVTPADVEKATSGMPPPAGGWQLTISPVGWKLLDPTGGGLLADVGYLSAGTVEMRPTIEYPPYPNLDEGGFCADTDPIFDWMVAVGIGGKALVLQPDGQDPCGDRIAILEGTWDRVGA